MKKVRVICSCGYDDVSFIFDEEQSAIQFASIAHGRMETEYDNDGKKKTNKVTLTFVDDEEKED